MSGTQQFVLAMFIVTVLATLIVYAIRQKLEVAAKGEINGVGSFELELTKQAKAEATSAIDDATRVKGSPDSPAPSASAGAWTV